MFEALVVTLREGSRARWCSPSRSPSLERQGRSALRWRAVRRHLRGDRRVRGTGCLAHPHLLQPGADRRDRHAGRRGAGAEPGDLDVACGASPQTRGRGRYRARRGRAAWRVRGVPVRFRHGRARRRRDRDLPVGRLFQQRRARPLARRRHRSAARGGVRRAVRAREPAGSAQAVLLVHHGALDPDLAPAPGRRTPRAVRGRGAAGEPS